MDKKEEEKLLNNTIKLIQRGEKYEAMFNEIRKDYYQTTLVENGAIVMMGRKMDDIEQRYFPEPSNKLVGLMKKMDEQVKEILKELGG